MAKSFLKSMGMDTEFFGSKKADRILKAKLAKFADEENGSVDSDNPCHIEFGNEEFVLHVYGSLDEKDQEHYQSLIENVLPTRFTAGILSDTIEGAIRLVFKQISKDRN